MAKDDVLRVFEKLRYRPADFIDAFWLNEEGEPVKLDPIQRKVANLRFKPDGSGIDPASPNLYVINKPRQTGFTKVVFAGRKFHAALYGHSPAEIVVVDAERKAVEFLNLIRRNVENLQQNWGIPIKLVKDREDHLEFSNGSKIVALSSNPSALRFWTGNILLDEFAFHENQEALFRAAIAIAQGAYAKVRRELVICSTPNGEGNKYHEIWQLANNPNKKSPWVPILAKWRDFPRLAAQIDEIRASMDELTFRQEYCNEFIASKTAFFTPEVLDNATHDLENYAKFACSPEEGVLWAMVDFGAMSDQTSAWVVLRRPDRTKQPVAWRRWKGPYKEQMPRVAEWLSNFGIQRLRADNTGVGVAVVPMLQEALHKLGVWLTVEPINFTNEWKAKVITEFKAQLEARSTLIPRDPQLRDQLLGLRREILPGGGVRFSHATGYHDDDVWALAGACEEEIVPVREPRIRKIVW